MKHIITSTVAHLTIPPPFCDLSACKVEMVNVSDLRIKKKMPILAATYTDE